MSTGPGSVTALAVELSGRRIGVLTRLPGDNQIFSFEQDYIDDPLRPTLSLSYKNRDGGLFTSVKQFHRRVPPFFSNLLPEGHLRTYLADRAAVNPEREFLLLAALGADLPGGVSVTALDAAPRHPPSGRPTRRPAAANGPLRFSLAGVQLKFSALIESSGGLTIPARGVGGDWIVKLPSANFAAVAENEFVMLELARAIGIPVPRTRLISVRSIRGLPPDAAALPGSALAVERFDRAPAGHRIHMEDFAQVFGIFPEGKYRSVSYANIARVLWTETGEAGAYEFVRRLAFSVLIGNGDMHLKNWSLLYRDSRTPELAPAYDFVATRPYIAGDSLALTFGGDRSLDGITRDQVRRFCDTAGLSVPPVVRTIRETADAVVHAWRALPHKDLLQAGLRKSIRTQIHRAAAAVLPLT